MIIPIKVGCRWLGWIVPSLITRRSLVQVQVAPCLYLESYVLSDPLYSSAKKAFFPHLILMALLGAANRPIPFYPKRDILSARRACEKRYEKTASNWD